MPGGDGGAVTDQSNSEPDSDSDPHSRHGASGSTYNHDHVVVRRPSMHEEDDQQADLAEIATLRTIAGGGGDIDQNRPTCVRHSVVSKGHSAVHSLNHGLPPMNAEFEAVADSRPDQGGHAGEVLNFFRHVNKDAHRLKRAGSKGVRGCGGMVLRVLTVCGRRLRSLGGFAYSVPRPRLSSSLLASNDNGEINSSAGNRAHRRRTTRDSSNGAESLVDDTDSEEEEDTSEELSVQKKKVNDLGELPALDWTNTSTKLLFAIIMCGSILLSTLSGWMDHCVQAGSLCLREWLNAGCVAVGALFAIELLAKVLALIFKWTRLLHTSNNVWIFIRLHKDVSLLIWSVMLVGLWSWFRTTDWVFDEGGAVGQILGCFLAYTSVKLVKEICRVEMAHQYMWKPYLERARASIWAQYVIFMMTDFCLGLQTKDTEGQALALGFTNAKKGDEHMSLYTIGKAIVFVHSNALRHPLGAGRPGTDKDGMIDSKNGARLFGGLLFDALIIHFNEEAGLQKKTTSAEGIFAAAAASAAATLAAEKRALSGPSASMTDPTSTQAYDSVDLPRPSVVKQGAHQASAASPSPPQPLKREPLKLNTPPPASNRHLPSVTEAFGDEDSLGEDGEDDNRVTQGGMQNEAAGIERQLEPGGTEGGEAGKQLPQRPLSGGGEAAGETVSLTLPRGLSQVTSENDGILPALHVSVGNDSGASRGTGPPVSVWPTAAERTATAETRRIPSSTDNKRGAPHQITSSTPAVQAGHRMGARSSFSGRAAGAIKGISLCHLRQMTSKAVALKIMELFDVTPDGTLNRKEFVDKVIDIFVQRRSLQLTLGDYEAILKKVSYLLTVVSTVVLAFVALRILGYDLGNLFLTWLSLAVAFSFLFGSSASAFFESIIFVFITKAYDVGDPIWFVDDTNEENWYIVARINMLTTVLRRWDGQSMLVANNLMARKAIKNQWRSWPFLHHTMISVSADTPMEKLDQMKAGIAAGMRRGRHRNKHGEGGLLPDTVDYSIKGLIDGNRVMVFVCCMQRDNSANMSRRWRNASFFLKLLVRECNRHGITYTLPPQPFLAKGGSGLGPEADAAMRARDALLGAKLGSAEAKR